MDISLHQLAPGAKAEVTAIGCCPELTSRLADFGLIPGTVVSCRYESPGRDLKALELRSSVLAIRSTDLARIRARVL